MAPPTKTLINIDDASIAETTPQKPGRSRKEAYSLYAYVFPTIIFLYTAYLASRINTAACTLTAAALAAILLLSLHARKPSTITGITGIIAAAAQVLILTLTPPPLPVLLLSLSILIPVLYLGLPLLRGAPIDKPPTKPLYAVLAASLLLLGYGIYSGHEILPQAATALTLTCTALLYAYRYGILAAPGVELTLSLTAIYTALAPGDAATAIKTTLIGLAVLVLNPATGIHNGAKLQVKAYARG